MFWALVVLIVVGLWLVADVALWLGAMGLAWLVRAAFRA